MGKKRIKTPPPVKGARVSAQDVEDPNKLPPLFSLERVQGGDYCFSCLPKEDKAAVAESLFKRRTLSWNDLIKAPRHGLGTEQMPVGRIGQSRPLFITEDTDSYIVFRYNGKKAMVGYRQGRIFYILWFDHNFTLYDHG